MAQIRPFRAVRPAEGYEARIAALPYDVYDQGEARRAVAGKPLSFLCIDRAETQLPEGTDPYSPEVYRKAAALYAQEKAEGYFIQEETPCYYIYRLTMEGRSQTGLAACSAVSDYLSGVCKKHENTVQKKEEDRIRHVRALEAQTGPIFLAYRKDAVISELLAGETEKPPLYDFVSEDGVRHQLWRIQEPETVNVILQRRCPAPTSQTGITGRLPQSRRPWPCGRKRTRRRPERRGRRTEGTGRKTHMIISFPCCFRMRSFASWIITGW